MQLDDITLGSFSSVAEMIDLEKKMLPFGPYVSVQSWAFRGQPRPFGTLAPSFQRQFSRQSFGAAEIIEHRLIDAFREHYKKLDDINRYMPSPARIQQGFDLRCLSVMQHYEIPTRLLDWSSNFWTSVYFACASDTGENAEFWFYHRSIFDNQRMANPMLNNLLDASENVAQEPILLNQVELLKLFELDPRITPRMKEQFAHHTVSTNVFSDHAPLLHELMQQAPAVPPGELPLFGRFIIDAACKGKALQFLEVEKNITASTIFPDVVGLGRFLRWQFETLRTMLL